MTTEVDLGKLVCIQDFEDAAEAILDLNAWEYYRSGSDAEITVKENKAAYLRWLIKPRVLRDVSLRDVSTMVLGKPVAFPLGISPTAMHGMAHPDAELGVAKAAGALGTIYIAATIATTSIEDIAAAAPNARKWFQLYICKDRDVTCRLIRRAEAAGFEALVFTVDSSWFGNRRSNLRTKFALPGHLSLANFQDLGDKSYPAEGFSRYVSDNLDQTLSWKDLTWLKKFTRLPVVVKGILTPEDARLAADHGADGVFLSNHGGRQVDTVSATIDALPASVKAVSGKCEVYVDGGATRGTDIFKALALGAKMAFAGRPALWGLAVDGRRGVEKVLSIYKEELDLTMALAGVSSISQISFAYLIRSSSL